MGHWWSERSRQAACRNWPTHPSQDLLYNLRETPMSKINFFHGLIPAIAVPFRNDYSIDEAELRRFVAWLGQRPGITALMTNGHTGEVFSLTPRERAEVTRITADATKNICPVI